MVFGEGQLPDSGDDYDPANHDYGDESNKTKDFLFDGREASFRCARELGDLTENGLVASGDDDSGSRTRDAVCALEADAMCLQVVVIGRVGGGSDRLGFTFM